MRRTLQRVYWSAVTFVSVVLVYESVANQVYGDNSFWSAVVFLGVTVLSLVRLASTRGGASQS